MTVMTKYNLLLMALLAVFSFLSCDTEDYDNVGKERTDLVSFTFVGDEPVVAAPDEEVYYTFKVAYPKGLSCIAAYLDGKKVEGSERVWDDAPIECDYSFSYVVKGAEFGQTLDFVFTAVGVDGYMQSVDYPLWVSANEVEFTLSLDENIPTKVYSNESVQFELNVTCGNVLKSFVVTKNGLDFYSKNDFGATDKALKYTFAYSPVLDDVGQTVEFHFVATDVKGNIAEAYYIVEVVKADVVGKELYSEIFDTSLSISGTSAFNTTEGGISGGAATAFNPANINTYATLLVEDPENPEGGMKDNPGAMEGCQVYDNDLSALTYTSDGTDVCLSKLEKPTEFTGVPGTYLWYRKANNGWFRVDGIKLHGAIDLKLTYAQATKNGKIKVEYSLDSGVSWTEIIATGAVSEKHEQKFSLPQAAETISLKFTENGGSAHVRVDNIKLVEIL